MSITFPGFIWIVLLMFAFFQKTPKYMIAITLLSMVFQSTSLLLIGEDGIGPQIIVSGAMVIYTIMMSLRTIKLSKKVFTIKSVSMFAAIAVLIIILCSHNLNFRSYTIELRRFFLMFCMLFIYVLCYFFFWRFARQLEEGELESIIIGIVIFVSGIGILQFLTTINILPRNILWETLIYTPDTDSAYYWGAYYPRIFSTFMEPSYCGAFLVGAFYYVLTRKINKWRICLSVCLAIEVILTFSSTAYGAFAIVGIIYLFRKNKKAIRYLAPLSIIILLFIFLFYSKEMVEVFDKVIFRKNMTGSFSNRAVWDKNAMRQFLSSPWLGIGYKKVRGSQFIYSILGQIGILGTIAWIVMIFPLFICGFKLRKIKPNSEIFFLISSMVSMCIAIPDMDFCVFWQSMYIFALAYGKYFNDNSKNAIGGKNEDET